MLGAQSLGGIVFFAGVFGSRVASRDLRRHRTVIRDIEQRLKAMDTAPQDEAERYVPERHPPSVQSMYDELNNASLGFHTACLRRDCCVGLFIVGLLLSHWAIVPAGCIAGLGLIGGRIAHRDVKHHRLGIAILEHRLKQVAGRARHDVA